METPAVVQEPVAYVANAVQNTHKELSTQLQQIQLMMQAMQMQITAVPHVTRQDYGGRQDYVGHGYHSNQSSYRGRGGRGSQNNGNWRVGHGGRANSILTHYCLTHGMCAHLGNDCRTPADGHQKDLVWCNKMSGSERNCI